MEYATSAFSIFAFIALLPHRETFIINSGDRPCAYFFQKNPSKLH